jgi:uncharacterized membrane protein
VLLFRGMKSIEGSLSDGLPSRNLDENIGRVALVRQVADVFLVSGGGSMVGVYAAPRLVSRSKGRDVVDSEWLVVLAVAGVVATLLGIAVGTVVSVCYFCGTLGSITACYWTIVSWLHLHWC